MLRINILSLTSLLNTNREARLIIIVLAMVCGLSVSGSSMEGTKISALIENPKTEKQEDDWRMALGIPVLLTFGLFVLGNRKIKKSLTSSRKEKKTKKKRGRWKNVPY